MVTASVALTAIVSAVILPFAGQSDATLGVTLPIAGAVVSRTVTLKLADAPLLDPSVAEHMTVVVPRPKVDGDAFVQLGVSDPLTMSVALAVKLTDAPDGPVASTTISAGTVTDGGVVSRTVTVKLADAALCPPSIAEHVTVVVPSPNVDGDAFVQDGVSAPLTISVALAAKLTDAPDGPVASTTMLAGTVTDGGVVSRTVTLKLADAVLLEASVAEHVTGVVPSPNVDGDGFEQLAVSAPLTLSLALAAKLTDAPEGPVASTTMSAGTVTDGFVVSRTITLKLADPVLCAASVAQQVTGVVTSPNVPGESQGKRLPPSESTISRPSVVPQSSAIPA